MAEVIGNTEEKKDSMQESIQESIEEEISDAKYIKYMSYIEDNQKVLQYNDKVSVVLLMKSWDLEKFIIKVEGKKGGRVVLNKLPRSKVKTVYLTVKSRVKRLEVKMNGVDISTCKTTKDPDVSGIYEHSNGQKMIKIEFYYQNNSHVGHFAYDDTMISVDQYIKDQIAKGTFSVIGTSSSVYENNNTANQNTKLFLIYKEEKLIYNDTTLIKDIFVDIGGYVVDVMLV
jgi:hypothetical protein